MYNTVLQNKSLSSNNVVPLHPNKVTLRAIADKFGCSENTVSLVLRGKGRISDHTRHKIKKIADNLGYVPNMAARSLALSRSGLVGIFIHSLFDYVRVEQVKCLMETLHDEHCKPLLGLDEHLEGVWYESSWIRTFQMLNVEAIITVSENFTEIPKMLKHIPTISVGIQPSTEPVCDAVALDRYEAGMMAAQHLLEKGHKKITLISSKGHFEQGVAKVLNTCNGIAWETIDIDKAGCEKERHVTYDVKTIYNWMRESGLRSSAVICGDSLVAANLTKECIANGISIPSDIAFVAYDYLPNVDSYPVPLTLIEQPIHEMAIATKELLDRRLNSLNEPYQQIILKHKIVERASTATANKCITAESHLP